MWAWRTVKWESPLIHILKNTQIYFANYEINWENLRKLRNKGKLGKLMIYDLPLLDFHNGTLFCLKSIQGCYISIVKCKIKCVFWNSYTWFVILYFRLYLCPSMSLNWMGRKAGELLVLGILKSLQSSMRSFYEGNGEKKGMLWKQMFVF